MTKEEVEELLILFCDYVAWTLVECVIVSQVLVWLLIFLWRN